MVELVPALPPGPHQPRRLQDVEVLGDRLPRRAQPVLGREPGAELEQRLPVPLAELVEDRPPGRVGERPVHVAYGPVPAPDGAGRLPRWYGPVADVAAAPPVAGSRPLVRSGCLSCMGAGHGEDRLAHRRTWRTCGGGPGPPPRRRR